MSDAYLVKSHIDMIESDSKYLAWVIWVLSYFYSSSYINAHPQLLSLRLSNGKPLGLKDLFEIVFLIEGFQVPFICEGIVWIYIFE